MASLITANRGDDVSMSLDQAGFRHGRKFVVYAEVLDFADFDASEFEEGAFVSCEAQRVDGKKHGWWNEVGSRHLPSFGERISSQFQLLWYAMFEVGLYRVVLRISGRIVAEREVEVVEGTS